jgi:prophage maintenance system killer protein
MQTKQKKQISIENGKGRVILYKNRLEVRLEQDTVWLTQKQMAELFQKDIRTINEHIRNVFKESELLSEAVIRNFRITASDGKIYDTAHYNLDVIISVGYRVKSLRGTQFRIWATNVLRQHLVEGYTINEKRLKAQKDKISNLQETVRLLGNIAQLENVYEEARGIIQIISEYSWALNVLDDFDHQRLTAPKGTKQTKYKLDYFEARSIIDQMRMKFKGSNLFGQEKDKSFKGSIGAIYQTFTGKELYPTIEEKTAHLLYFVTKNHSFVDGNKRIAAALFVCFLLRNGILLHKDGSKRIDDNALVALTHTHDCRQPSIRERNYDKSYPEFAERKRKRLKL